MTRVRFLVDGFNLYHSIQDAIESSDNPHTSLKWLDLRSFLGSCLDMLGPSCVMEDVHFFTAYAHFQGGAHVGRHQHYVRALEATGVVAHIGRFKRKPRDCQRCGQLNYWPEEKETDVAIGVSLVETLVKDEADAVAIVTGDTDLVPAVRCAKRLFPRAPVFFLYPFGRANKEGTAVADGAYKLKVGRYAKHQLADPLATPSGHFGKPVGW